MNIHNIMTRMVQEQDILKKEKAFWVMNIRSIMTRKAKRWKNLKRTK